MAKPHLASHYLHRALQEDESAIKTLPKLEGGKSLFLGQYFMTAISRNCKEKLLQISGRFYLCI